MEETVVEMVMDVSYLNMKVMGTVMMETTMMLVLMMEAIAALVLVHQMDGILTVLFVNVKRMVMTVEEMVMEVSTLTGPCLSSHMCNPYPNP